MNSLKNVLVITVLLTVGYAVYTTINSQPGPARPPEQTDGWPTSVNVQMPSGADSKSAATRNPFAARSDQTAESVSARDADPFTSPRGSASSAATSRPPSRPNDRALSGFSEGEGKSGAPFRDSAPYSAGTGRSRGSFAGESPGVAMTSDLPPGSPPAAGAPAGRKSDSPGPDASGVQAKFAAIMKDAERRLAKGELAEVHLSLSRYYDNPDLTAEQSRRLTELLDQLAGTVIYSRQHLLEPPYVVKLDDTLERIARNYNVPWQLLAKINGIRHPARLQPGTQLKVVRGPFNAVIHLQRYELVLMLGGRYAGRFPIGIGRDNPRLEGSYTVRRKVVDPPYLGPDRSFPPGDPDNPLGRFWIELADKLALHGTNDKNNLRRSDGRGTICLGPRDIEDLYDILSARSEAVAGSKVTILR